MCGLGKIDSSKNFVKQLVKVSVQIPWTSLALTGIQLFSQQHYQFLPLYDSKLTKSINFDFLRLRIRLAYTKPSLNIRGIHLLMLAELNLNKLNETVELERN